MSVEKLPPLAEQDLLAKAKQGDRDAGGELAKRHRRAAYLFALQLTGNPDDALDISQEAMLRLFSNIGTLDHGRPVRPWLLTVVRNRARDLWRRQKVRKSEPLASEAGPDLGRQIVDPKADPQRDAEKEQLRRRLWEALRSLSEPQREILVLRDYHDLAYSELADVLGIPMGTVMSRLHGARRALREVYLAKRGSDRV